MKLNAVAVSTTNFEQSVKFYEALGFQFPEYKVEDQHVESVNPGQHVRLMIDASELMTDSLGEAPKPGNHSMFAIEFDTPAEVDAVVKKITEADFTVFKAPWDAPWGQRYAIVEDPEGYRVDLYATL